MESASPAGTWGMKVVALLALVQSVLGVLRTIRWFDVGTDLLGQGLLLLPVVGVLAFLRGGLIAGIALIYVLFAYGMFSGKSWAWWVGLFAAVLSILLALLVLAHGERPVLVFMWMVVPVIMVVYLLSPAGQTLRKN